MDDLSNIAVSNAVAATVLALLAIAVSAVSRRPALVHGLWLLVLLKLVTPPLVFLPVIWHFSAESPPQIAAVPEEPKVAPLPAEEERPALVIVPHSEREEAAEVEASQPVEAFGTLTQPRSPMPLDASLWPQVLRIVWTFGALTWFLLALERLEHFRRLLRFARPAPAALQERTRLLARSLGLRRCPRVRLLPGRLPPMLWAIAGPPRLLVPADLLAVLNDGQLDTLLLHELAHLRRRDHWVRILEFVVMGLYWWHPVVWYARRELREAEEQCCDAWVVSTLPGAGRTYASALLDTLDFLSTAQTAVPPLASGLGQVADLKRRLTMIMRGNTPRSLTWPGCLAVVVLAAFFLPLLPAQSTTPRSEDDERDEIKKRLDQDISSQKLNEERAKLEKLEAELQLRRAEIAAAQARLKAAVAAQRDRLKKEANQKAQIAREKIIVARALRDPRDDRNDAKGKKVMIRIVLVGDDINPKDLSKKLSSVLPKGSLIQIDESISVGSADKIKDGARIIIQDGNKMLELASRGAGPVPPPMKAPPGAPGLPGSSQDKRINDLEQKLERVLRELQDMRKQMRQPRGRPAPAPSPAASPVPPEAPTQPGEIAVPLAPAAPAAVSLPRPGVLPRRPTTPPPPSAPPQP